MAFTLLLVLFSMCDVIVLLIVQSGLTDSALFHAPLRTPFVEQRLLIGSGVRLLVGSLPTLVAVLYYVSFRGLWHTACAWLVVALVASLVAGGVARVIWYAMSSGAVVSLSPTAAAAANGNTVKAEDLVSATSSVSAERGLPRAYQDPGYCAPAFSL
jgi:hypothetical protein